MEAGRPAEWLLCSLHPAVPAKRGGEGRSREMELGRSMHVWLGVMGLASAVRPTIGQRAGATNFRLFTDILYPARRAAGCGATRGSSTARSVSRATGNQLTLWQERVLSERVFYKALLDHPVPVSESALKAIGPRSMVIDVYIWLAYRLHALKENIEIGWPALHAQFGGGFDRIRAFRAHFLEALQIALAAYPDACVSLGERGLVLHPSRPAIAKV